MQQRKSEELNRREALKTTALLLGYGLSAGTSALVLKGCSVDQSSKWKPAFFNSEQLETVLAIADRFIPKTNTPGARDLNLDRFIDYNLNANYDPEVQSMVQDFVIEIDEISKEKNGFVFHKLTKKEKDELLVPILRDGIDKIDDWVDLDDEDKNGLLILRELSVLGYCTNETIMQEHLIFDPVPGEYRGCINYDEVGGVWAL